MSLATLGGAGGREPYSDHKTSPQPELNAKVVSHEFHTE